MIGRELVWIQNGTQIPKMRSQFEYERNISNRRRRTGLVGPASSNFASL